MKIRTGFVSNSSSSSFVVIFPMEPKCADDVKRMLFKENQLYYGDSYSVDQVSETVWKDILDQQKNDIEKATEIMGQSDFGTGSPDYDDFKHIEDNHERWEAYSDATDRYAKKALNEFFNVRKLKLKVIDGEDVEGGVMYCFSYSDNDGQYYSDLEHDGLFNNLKHVTVSQH